MSKHDESSRYGSFADVMPRTSDVVTSSTFEGWNVVAKWDAVGGRAEPISVEVSSEGRPRAVGASMIRKLPLGEMLDEARGAVRNLKSTRKTWVGPFAALFPNDVLGPDIGVYGSQRGRSLTDEDLAATAAVYRVAWESGDPLNEAVRGAFFLSKDGAAKRIMKARAAGLLDGIGPKR